MRLHVRPPTQVDEKQKVVRLTEIGYEEAELVLKVTDLYHFKEQWASFLLNAIKASSFCVLSFPTCVPALCCLPSCLPSLSASLLCPTQVDEKQKVVLLTEIGYEEAELVLKVTDLYDPKEQWASFLLNAIKAKELFAKDVQYIVRDGAVLIVDEFTGRIMEGRRWSEGVHQAVEAKEGVAIQNETVSLASISYQNFFLQVWQVYV
ncbi:unnamed protein product [Closterium sp. NIES-53]